jgi:hypothetical protein
MRLLENLPPEIVEEFLERSKEIEEESNARRAVTGEEGTTILIGINDEKTRLAFIDPEEARTGIVPAPLNLRDKLSDN